MKNITIAGNIGQNAEIRRTQSGDAVTVFSVAVEDRHGQEKRTLWFRCSLWGKRGESLAQYITKGTRVAVAGDLSTREYDGKTYLEVRVAEITLLGGGEQRQQSDNRQQEQRRDEKRGYDDIEDQIPF